MKKFLTIGLIGIIFMLISCTKKPTQVIAEGTITLHSYDTYVDSCNVKGGDTISVSIDADSAVSASGLLVSSDTTFSFIYVEWIWTSPFTFDGKFEIPKDGMLSLSITNGGSQENEVYRKYELIPRR